MKTLKKLLCVAMIIAAAQIPAHLLAADALPQAAEVKIAKPSLAANVPEPLRPWISWALSGDEAALCPFLSSSRGEAICAWPTPVNVALTDRGGSFAMRWRIFGKPMWVSLPGGAAGWPQGVKINGRPAAVIEKQDRPSLYLEPGDYAIDGAFIWSSLPESLEFPSAIGAVSLSINGAQIQPVKRSADGALWIRSSGTAAVGTDDLSIKVFRKLSDEIPFYLDTKLLISASGKPREVVIGRPMLPGFLPMGISGGLPARIGSDGNLSVQVKAGEWEISIASRLEGDAQEFAMTARSEGDGSIWPDFEIWSFEQHPERRLATIEGASTIDPKQTTMPSEWSGLPSYRVTSGEVIKVVERSRGDLSADADNLNLTRKLWLNFDGDGYSFKDSITGENRMSSRIEMDHPGVLGRAAVNGSEMLITKLPQGDNGGIEIRRGQLSVEADGRIEGGRFTLPAIGWDHGMKSLSIDLFIPPGWRIFSTIGSDVTNSTWISQWRLIDIFLVLVLGFSCVKLFGMRWGVVAFAAFALTFTELDAPKWSWVAAIILCAIVTALPEGRIRKFASSMRFIAIIILIIIAIPFAIDQLRMAIYPSLAVGDYPEAFWNLGGSSAPHDKKARPMVVQPSAVMRRADLPEAEAPMEPSDGMMSEDSDTSGAEPEVRSMAGLHAKMEGGAPKKVSGVMNELDALIQTGFGVPNWEGKILGVKRQSQLVAKLKWSGPVDKGQQLKIFLLPPWINLLLSFVRVIALAALIARTLSVSGKNMCSWIKGGGVRAAASILLFAIIATASSVASASDLPSKELLAELKAKLTTRPACYPVCADISAMRIEGQDDTLRITIEAQSSHASAIEIPGSVDGWTASRATIDGAAPASIVRADDGSLWLELEPGGHQIVLEGALLGKQVIDIPLPMKPHHLDINLPGFSVEGLSDDGEISDAITLTRSGTQASAKPDEISDQSFPPFVKVTREIEIGLDWHVKNSVERLTPSGSPLILSIPMLANETSIDQNVKVENSNAVVVIQAQDQRIEWNSRIEPSDRISLSSAKGVNWVEVWRLSASPIWHYDIPEGSIPSIDQPGGMISSTMEWRPMPGDALSINISRPQGAAGDTKTIDESNLVISPGKRSTEVALNFELRSSLGGDHVITIPSSAKLESVSAAGTPLSVRSDGGRLVLPISPGKTRFDLKWNEPSGFAMLFKPEVVDLGMKSVNGDIEINPPDGRWILMVGGPNLGPAVLIWGVIAVLIIISIALGRAKVTPLKAHQWVLLGLGLTQVPAAAAVFVVLWFLLLGWRERQDCECVVGFNLLQIVVVVSTLAAMGVIVYSIYEGLLGNPDMQISGNGSSAANLIWSIDRMGGRSPQPYVISLPMYCYRIAMLAWALWLAKSLIVWIKWGWTAFSSRGLWRCGGSKVV